LRKSFARWAVIVLDNIVYELQRAGGISKYWSKTTERIDRFDLDVAYLEGKRATDNIFRQALKLKGPVIQDRGFLPIRRLATATISARVFHSSYYRISRSARHNVVTIHDLINELFPKSFRDSILARVKRRAIEAADRIVVVSECTKRDLLRYYGGIDPEVVHVIYNGVDQEFFPELVEGPLRVQRQALRPRLYFLYVGTRGYCKNFEWVLKFYSLAVRQGFQGQLVLVGGGNLSRAERATLAHAGIEQARVVSLQGVQSIELRRLYSNATAVLIPSLYEGFGLPALEAARCGALTLASNRSALPEIVGESDYMIDLDAPDEISRLLSLGFDGVKAADERDRVLQRSHAFDWDRSIEQLRNIYDELAT